LTKSVLNNKLLWVGIHLGMGILIGNELFSKVLALGIVFFGAVFIYTRKNEGQEAVLFSAYLVGSEVLFRMTGGAVLHEMTKYVVIVFLTMGLLLEPKKHHINPVYILYILFLLLGITFSDVPYPESIRKAIAFNLSGPFLVGVAAMYFYNRKVSVQQLLNMLFFIGLPVVCLVSFLFFRTPSPQDMIFGAEANFEMSGGFGPNQVSTILGVGFFVIAVHLLSKKSYTGNTYLDYFLLSYVLYRTFLTFSRGGLYTVLIAMAAFLLFTYLSKKNKGEFLKRYIGMPLLLLLSVWLYTSMITGGKLENRFLNTTEKGEIKQNITTGRAELFEQELEAFFENPIVGIGVGSAKYFRLDESGKVAATHSEVSRLLSEHGMVGLIIIGLLLLVPTMHFWKQSYKSKAFLAAFLLIWFLTINHSAMRVALPAFFYGLSLINLTKKES